MERAWQSRAGCAQSPARSEVPLIAAIPSEADTDVNHLEGYAEHADGFGALQQLLHKQLYRLFCPTSDHLIDYQQGMLSGEQRAAIAQHLSICPHCTREIALIERMVERP